jgi:hypothetical protein
MGLDILTAELKKIRQNQTAAGQTGWFFSIAGLLCLEEFLLLLFSAGVLKPFKEALIVLITTTAAEIALLEVVTAQLLAANNIIEAFINTFTSALAAAQAKLSLFPFSNPAFQQCPIVQTIEQDIVSALPSTSGAFAKVYKKGLAEIQLLKYQLLRNQKYLLQVNAQITNLQASVLAWQAIVNAISAQFGI